jgi:cell division septation protein DedD
MQFGSFGGWTTSVLTSSVLQENVGNIARRGNYVQVSGGKVGDVSGVALQARVNGDTAGYMAYQFTRLALGQNAQLVNFEADTRGGILGFTAIGQDGTSISYRPGEGGTGVLTITRNGKTLTTKVNSDGSIEGITTGKLSEGIVAMFGQSLAQAWARELANVQKDSETLSKLISQARGIQEREDFEKFYQNVREALTQTRTEHAREALRRIAEAVEEALKKERGVRRQSTTGSEDYFSQQYGVGGTMGVGLEGTGTTTSSGQGGKGSRSLTGRLPAQAGVLVSDSYGEGQRSYNREEASVYRDVNRSQTDKKSQEKALSDAQRKSDLDALGRSIRDGISYALRTGSFEEVGRTISKALQYAWENLESYKQTLQATDSAELRTALLPKVFNQLKQEEAQKLQNSGLSKEEIEAKAAMNALARLDDMIEKNPKALFKYINSISGLPDAEGLKKKVEEKTPQEGTVGNPTPELQQRIEDAQNKLNSEYSLTVSAGKDIRQAQRLANTLSKRTGREAQIIRTDKGYMVRVGGFQSDDMARGLAQGLGLKNYRIEKVEPHAENTLKDQFSLNVFVGRDMNKVDRLAQALSKRTGGEVQIIRTDKGYMVSVGGFQSEEDARRLAQGLRLRNYRIEKVEPQQPQPQQPPAPAKR